MWHNVVSSTDMMANRFVLGFVETSWRYPFVTAGVLATFLVLTAMFWIEILSHRSGRSSPDEAPPIRLKL